MKNRKQSGFTLVELLVAFAVLGIAVLGIGGFFVSAARSYSSVSDETSLQYEAQLALNQVENMLIDSTLGVSYNYVTDADEDVSGYQFVENDSAATGGNAAVSKVLYAYNANVADSSKLDLLMMKWIADKKAIYYKVITVADNSVPINEISIAGSDENNGGWDLLAEDVVSFSADLSGYATNKKVEVNFGFENRSKDYQTTGTVLLRNDVLINATDISKIYEHITVVSPSLIDGVSLTAAPMVTVPGGAVQLRAKVSGSGYPNRDIYQWLVASDSAFANILYDSTIEYGAEDMPARPATYIESSGTNHVLNVSNDIEADINNGDWNETVHVKAVVKTTNAAGEVVYYSDTVAIGVKLINNILVTVTADAGLHNSNLSGVTFSEASLVSQRANSAAVPEMNLRPKNQVKMAASVTASNVASGDTEIIWSIVNKSEGVIANIDNTGNLKIDQYSQVGDFVVRASLKIDSSVYVDYKVLVGTQYDAETANLVIVPEKNSINRGGSTACTLTLDDEPVDNKDYNWSVSVISSNGQEISGTPVTVNGEGGVYANYDLSYDYSYEVWITAALKVNPEIRDTVKISVPKVSLSVSPMTKYSVMGGKVTGITCTASGLEDYDIKWAMSKDLNPNYFFTAWGNFNITGSKNANGTGNATVILGSESDPQTNATVKAYLKDNTNYSATMRVLTGDVSMNITGGTTVKRGNTLALNLTVTGTTNTNITVSKDTASWEITEVKVDGNSVPALIDNSISISKGILTVEENFAEAYNKKNVVVTIRAYDDNYGLEDTHTVTVQRKFNGIFPDYNILIPDLSGPTTIEYTHYDGAVWSLVRKEGSGQKTVFIDANGKLTANENSQWTSDNATYEVSMTLDGEDTITRKVRYGFESNPNYSTTRTSETWVEESGGSGSGIPGMPGMPGMPGIPGMPGMPGMGSGGNIGSQKVKQVTEYKILNPDYYVYNNGKKCPVYYVNYVVYKERYYGQETVTSIKYAFVSSKESVDGDGQWYIYTDGMYSYWSTTNAAPTGWDNAYFE